jgi:hypothetical protein
MADGIEQAIREAIEAGEGAGTLSLAIAGLSGWLDIEGAVQFDEGAAFIRAKGDEDEVVVALAHISAVRWTPTSPPIVMEIDPDVLRILTE